ncbi:hypothetical protein ASL20_09810 [Cupriavidus necator]|uniref:hypothetical protein n=1 Tax=Cupriavidus necator TaxID=106590 RepID=UPI00073522E2|nr:hypothetical protein [Cupriavidus necator]KUE88907.1 hypothetical protein ASL20_09810 [Cupriavidus necator]
MDTQDNKMVRAPAHGTIEAHHFTNQPKGARMKELFFVSKQPELGAGVIEPGRWGRGYDVYRATRMYGGDPWMLVLEQAIEIERLNNHPTLPSRLTGAFAFPSLEAAMSTNNPGAFGTKAMALWKCELADPTAPLHMGFFPFFHELDGKTFEQVRAYAKSYWGGWDPRYPPEILTASPLRLTERLYEHIPGTGWISSPPQ